MTLREEPGKLPKFEKGGAKQKTHSSGPNADSSGKGLDSKATS